MFVGVVRNRTIYMLMRFVFGDPTSDSYAHPIYHYFHTPGKVQVNLAVSWSYATGIECKESVR